MAAIPHSKKNGNIVFFIPHIVRIKKMYSLQTLKRNPKTLHYEHDVLSLELSNDVGITITTSPKQWPF